MRRVLKFPLNFHGVTTIKGVLHEIQVGQQTGPQHMEQICLWAEVLEDWPKESSYIILPTGDYLTDAGMKHVGTAICNGGDFIWHVYRTR